MASIRDVRGRPISAGSGVSSEDRHCYAVVDGVEHVLEASSAFVTAGLRRSERVTLVGVTDQRATALLARLREDGTEPAEALWTRQLVLVDEAATSALYKMSAQEVTEQLARRVTAAVAEGFTGMRFGGLLPGTRISPHEETLNFVVRERPITVLCLYHVQAPAAVLSAAHRLHDRLVPSTALYDDGDMRVTAVPGRGLRLAGRITPANRANVLTVLSDAARCGRRTLDVASLREIDPLSLSAVLTTDLTLRRPHPAVEQLARQLATPPRALPCPEVGNRTGTSVPGQTGAAVVVNLAWRVFGDAKPGRAESVLDWAGLLGRPAASVTAAAAAHHIAPETLRHRVGQVRTRGAQTPLTPVVLRDVTRDTQSTEDHLSRCRVAELLGISFAPSPGGRHPQFPGDVSSP